MSDDKKFKDLCAQSAARAEETQTARCVPPDLARKFAEYGLMAMFVPQKIGGREWPAPHGLGLLEKLAESDASSAWVCMIGATAALGAAYIDPKSAKNMFATPKTRITCGIFAPNGTALPSGDDFIINGRWGWASGSGNADFIGLGCRVMETVDASPNAEPRLFMVPREKIIFHDTWHTLGLCGSGSGDVEVKNVRVPAAHSYMISQKPWGSGPLYRLPYFGFLAAGVAAVALGNARAALDDFLKLVMEKQPQGSARKLHQMSRIQNALACAEADWRAAHALYWMQVNQLWDVLQSADAPTIAQKADLRLATTHAVRQSAAVVRAAHDMAGGSSVFQKNPIQRRLRDADTMTQHMITGPAIYEMVGRVMLGGHFEGMML